MQGPLFPPMKPLLASAARYKALSSVMVPSYLIFKPALCLLVDFARAILNLVGQFIKSTGYLRVRYLRSQPARLDYLILNHDEQFYVVSQIMGLATRDVDEPNAKFVQLSRGNK
jgi:hypothetical protein